MKLNGFLKLFLCGWISIITCNAYSSSLAAVSNAAANFLPANPQAQAYNDGVNVGTLSLAVNSKDKTIAGNIVTLAISGPKDMQASCAINDNQPCILHLPAGTYHITAMGFTDNKSHYVGDAANETIIVKSGALTAATINYALSVPQKAQHKAATVTNSVSLPATNITSVQQSA